MNNPRGFSAVAALAVILTHAGAAQADPFADGWIQFNPVTSGTNYNGAQLSTWSDGDVDGVDALGGPDWNGSFSTGTVLGFDANSPDGPKGGALVLKFSDNTCTDGPGADIKIYEAYGSQSTTGNESGSVEISNDGGQTFVKVGEVSPTGGFEVDVAGAMGQFNYIRLTALDSAGSNSAAGLDVDSVECLNSVARPMPDTDPGSGSDDTAAAPVAGDGCDMMNGSTGADVRDVALSSDGLSLDVTLALCGPVEENAKYAVYFDYKGSDKNNRRAWGKDRKHGKKADKKTKRGRHDFDDDVFAGPAFSDGPDTLVNSRNCATTADAVATYRRGKTRGPGFFSAGDDQVSLEVNYGDLGLAPGAEVLVWVRTQDRKRYRLGDSIPNVEKGDRCHKPQFEEEVFAITLE